MAIAAVEGGVMFYRFKARMTGPGAGDSAPPTRRKGRLNLLAAVAVLLCVGLSASSALAAGLTISFKVTDVTSSATTGVLSGGATSGTPSIASGNVGNFNVTVVSTPNESAASSNLNTTTFEANNTGSVSSLLDILVTVQGYMLPTGSQLRLSSSANGNTTLATASNPATFATFADALNGLFTTTTGGSVVSTGLQNATVVGAPAATSYTFTSGEQNVQTSFNRGGGPFSITQEIQVRLNPGDNATLTLVSAVTAPLPSTAGLGLVLMGGLGGVGGIRRLNSRRALA